MVKYDYIRLKLKENGMLRDAMDYLQDMKTNGVRICNDGMPDARSPLTNTYPVRLEIARYREMHQQAFPHQMHVAYSKAKLGNNSQFVKGYHKALDDVTYSINTSHSIGVAVEIKERIAELRRIVNKEE